MEPKTEPGLKTSFQSCELLSGLRASGMEPLMSFGGRKLSAMSCCTVRKIKHVLKREVKNAVRCMCIDDNCLTQAVFVEILRSMIQTVSGLKGQKGVQCTKTEESCTGTCQCGCCCGCDCGCTCDPKGCRCTKGCTGQNCSTECCEMEMTLRNYAGAICKGFIQDRYKEVKEDINVALNAYRNLKGCLPIVCGKPGKEFVKATAMLVHKFCFKGGKSKEKEETIATKFWIEHMKESLRCVKHRSKHFALEFAKYMPKTEGDETRMLARDLSKMTMARGLTAFFLAQKLSLMQMRTEAQKQKEAQKGPETKEECCTEGLRYRWKRNRKFWKCCLRRQLGCFLRQCVKNYAEPAKIAAGVAKEQVESFFKTCHLTDDNRRYKLMSKIVAHTIFGAYNEHKSKEAITESAKKYARGLLTCCNKKCHKCSRRRVKLALKLNGLTDRDMLYFGSRWGGLASCRTCGKNGCPAQECTEFTAKWVKENVENVRAVTNLAKELIKEFKGLENNQFLRCFIMRKATMWYLRFNFKEGGKFNPDEFRAFWSTVVFKIRALMDEANRLLHESCRVACEGCEIKPEGAELNVMMLSMMELAISSGTLYPHKELEHTKRFGRLQEGLQTHLAVEKTRRRFFGKLARMHQMREEGMMERLIHWMNLGMGQERMGEKPETIAARRCNLS